MNFDSMYKKVILIENSKARSYSCLMLDCSDFKQELELIQSNILKEDLYDEEGYGFETEPHITVLYGIHEQEPDIVKDSINLNPIEYEITGLSLFENDDYDVLKCSIKSKELEKLNKECCDLLEYTNDYPDYIPHLTVAYLHPGRGKKYIKLKSKSFNKSKKSNKFFFSDKDSEKTYWKV